MPRELSRKPAQIKNRLRRGAGNLEADAQMLYEVTGRKPIEEWDDAELAHGRPRCKDGTFRGPSPRWLTPAIAAEARKRFLDKTHAQLIAVAGRANKVLVTLMEDKSVDARTRADIGKFIIEQTNGKAPVKATIEHKIGPKEFLASALVLDDGTPAHPVIDGQFYEDDRTVDQDDPYADLD